MEYNDLDGVVEILVSCFNILGCLRMVKIWWSFKWLEGMFLEGILLWNGMIFLSVWYKILLVNILGFLRFMLYILLINSSFVLGGEMFDWMIRIEVLIKFLIRFGVVLESDVFLLCVWVKVKFGIFFLDRVKSLENIDFNKK